MSEKKLKIIAVILMVAAFICLAIGTAFAVDFMAEHPEEFACDLKRPVVAANRPLVDPVVEPLNNVVSVDSSDVFFDASRFSVTSFNLSLESAFFSAGYFAVEPDQLYGTVNGSSVYFLGVGPGTYSFTYECFNADGDIISLSLYQITHLPYNSVYSEGNGFMRLTASDYDVELNFLEEPDGVQYVLYFYSVGSFDAAGAGYFLNLVSSVSAVGWVDSIVDTLMSGLTSTGEAIGQGLSTMANAIFINADGTGLSTFGILVVVFAAISLGLSLTRWVLNFCSSWGKRNR